MRTPRTLLLSLVFAAAAAACSDDTLTPDAGLTGASDAAARADATASAPDADNTADAAPSDAGTALDAASAPDAGSPDAASAPDAATADAGAATPSFAEIRRTVLSGCFCHSGSPGFEADEDTAYTSLLARTAGPAPCADRAFVVRDGQPNAAARSHLYQKLSGIDICAGDRMPAAGNLAPGALETLAAWIEAGAPR
jgi:hypothetical protein